VAKEPRYFYLKQKRRKAYLGSLIPLYIGWPQGGDESPKLVLLGASPSHPANYEARQLYPYTK